MRKLLILLISICIVSACSDDNNDTRDLNRELQLVLSQSSAGEGSDFFKLPSSATYGSLPQDPKNPLTKEKVDLGKNLFHETAFAVEGNFPFTKGEFSCASCHHAAAGFQSGLKQGIGDGGKGFGFAGEGRTRNELCDLSEVDLQPIRSPSILNTGYQLNMLWNGQFGATGDNEGTDAYWTEGTPKAVNTQGFEGLETQAIAGLSVHRMDFSPELIAANNYKEAFDAAFPDVPVSERYTLNNAGLAIAAYERTVISNQAPFQKYLNGNSFAMSDWEKEGAILFFGSAGCVSCHTGPALNKMEFHSLGMNEFAVSDVFLFDPMDVSRLGRASFTGLAEDNYKFKTPQLYNIRSASFYGHGASFNSIEEVVAYKNTGIPENPEATNISSLFQPLGLNQDEIEKITAFLDNGLFDPNLNRYVPESLPSGNCFPNNDDQSSIDLGCM